MARAEADLAALTYLSGAWTNWVHERKLADCLFLDLDSSESPTHGEQGSSAWNGRFRCVCYHPLFLFNQFGDLKRYLLWPSHVHSGGNWRTVLEQVLAHYYRRREEACPAAAAA